MSSSKKHPTGPTGRTEDKAPGAAQYEFQRKAAQLNMRVSKPLLEAVKDRALERGIPYTRYIRALLEKDIAGNKA